MNKPLANAAALAILLAIGCSAALLGGKAPEPSRLTAGDRPVWPKSHGLFRSINGDAA